MLYHMESEYVKYATQKFTRGSCAIKAWLNEDINDGAFISVFHMYIMRSIYWPHDALQYTTPLITPCYFWHAPQYISKYLRNVVEPPRNRDHTKTKEILALP